MHLGKITIRCRQAKTSDQQITNGNHLQVATFVIIHTSISFNSVIVELLSTEICESICLNSLTCHAVNNAVAAWVHVPHNHANRINRKD